MVVQESIHCQTDFSSSTHFDASDLVYEEDGLILQGNDQEHSIGIKVYQTRMSECFQVTLTYEELVHHLYLTAPSTQSSRHLQVNCELIQLANLTLIVALERPLDA